MFNESSNQLSGGPISTVMNSKVEKYRTLKINSLKVRIAEVFAEYYIQKPETVAN